MSFLGPRSQRPIRLVALLSAMVVATAFAARSKDTAMTPGLTARPSKLDYMVLASIADSQHFLTLAAYRAKAPQAAATPISKHRSQDD